MRNYEFEFVGFVPRKVLKAMNRQDKNKNKKSYKPKKRHRHA